jgi:hypothetical protein
MWDNYNTIASFSGPQKQAKQPGRGFRKSERKSENG